MSSTTLEVTNDEDVNTLRQTLRKRASELEFSNYEATKVVTAASEIARNILEYTGGGTVRVEDVNDGAEDRKLVLTFEDEGPGIDDIDLAMQDGFQGENSTGLGVGLPGARRLSDEFEIESNADDGTTVRLVVRTQTN